MAKKTSDITLEGFKFHIVMTGKAGTGKTVAAASWPKPYFFDFDNGLISLRGVKTDAEYDTYTDISSLQTKLKEFEHECPYETLVFDSLTVLSDLLLVYYAKLNGHADAFGRPNKQVGILEFGQRIGWYMGFLCSLPRLPVHTIVICHEETVKDDLLGVLTSRPAVPGQQLPDQLPALCDEVWRFEMTRDAKDIPEVKVHTCGSGRFVGKSRIGLPVELTLKPGDSLFAKVTAAMAARK